MNSKTEQYETCGFNWPFHRIKTRLRIFKPSLISISDKVFGHGERLNPKESNKTEATLQDVQSIEK